MNQICNAAAIGSANDNTSNGARSVTESTVFGQESEIQKNLNPSDGPLGPSG